MRAVIELPISVGDYVYCLSRLSKDKRFLPFINKHRITAISINIGKRRGQTVKYYYEGEIGTYSIDGKEIGNTVFLTKEEAEKAIEPPQEVQDDNNPYRIRTAETATEYTSTMTTKDERKEWGIVKKLRFYRKAVKWLWRHRAEDNNRHKWRRMMREVQE